MYKKNIYELKLEFTEKIIEFRKIDDQSIALYLLKN